MLNLLQFQGHEWAALTEAVSKFPQDMEIGNEVKAPLKLNLIYAGNPTIVNAIVKSF